MTTNQPPTPPPDPADGRPDKPETQEITIERAEELLTNGLITPVAGARLWGSNYSMLIYVSDSELQATAIYKPQRGERPLWDFPDGTLCYRETAAFVISEALGWQIVPPTVLRADAPHGIGSVQLFIDHDPAINYFNLDDNFVHQLQLFVLFDYLVNNADRKGGHLLLDQQGKLWGIDHGLTLHSIFKMRTVIWEFSQQAIAPPLLDDIQTMCNQLTPSQSPLRTKLAELISEEEITALQQRIQRLLEDKCYPAPGPGPNHPWPPV